MPNQSQKLSQLAAIPSVATTDLMYVVSASGGTLAGYKATVAQFTAALGGLALGDTIGGSPATGNVLVVGAGGVLAQSATIPGSQVAGDIGGNAAGITGPIAESQVTNLAADLAARAMDNTVIHTTGNETIAGTKTFTVPIVGSITGNATTATTAAALSGTIAESQVVGLVADLAARALDAAVVHTFGDETIGGAKTFTAKVVAPIVDAATTYDATNRDATTLPAGTPVAVHGSGIGFIAGDASTITNPAVGLLAAPVAPSAVGPVAISGPLTLADWTAAAGTATLAPRATYYLDATPGRITDTPPAVAGQVVQAVGVAVDPTTLDVRIAPTILL